MEQYRGTTILSVRRGNIVSIGGDGQVSLGNTVMKGNADHSLAQLDGINAIALEQSKPQPVQQ